MTTDSYSDPTTGILINRFGIDDPDRLAVVDADLSSAALSSLAMRILPGVYDLEHLRDFHREIFGDLYPWAGEIRTVSIAKTELFCLPAHIITYSHDVFAALASERHLRSLRRTDFVDRFAHYLAEINAVHPFRDGNGRAQRAFFGQLGRQAGWPVDWSRLDAQANIDASVAALRGDTGPLRDLLDDLIAR